MMKSRSSGPGLALALVLLTAGALSAQDPAQEAWERGDYVAADSLYGHRLAADSGDLVALHRRALATAWTKKYDESLVLFQRLRLRQPDDAGIALERARVLAWKQDYRAAGAAVDSVLAAHPDNVDALRTRLQIATWAGDQAALIPLYDRLLAVDPNRAQLLLDKAHALLEAGRRSDAAQAFEQVLAVDPTYGDARVGLARSYSWGGAQDTARAIYEALLRQQPGNLDGLRGVAQTYAWSGQLRQAEAAWQRALAVAPGDLPSLTGLAQTLRWQGRAAEAQSVLERARKLAPDDPEVRTQLAWAHAATAPRVFTADSYEHDSDGNAVTTSRLLLRWNPAARLEIAADGYRKSLVIDSAHAVSYPGRLGALDRHSYGGLLTLTGLLASGWGVSAGAGAATANGADTWVGRYTAALRSPAGRGVVGELSFQRSLFDYTALLADNGIIFRELALSAETAPTAAWTASLRTAGAILDGAEQNRRLLVRGATAYRVARQWRLGVAATGLGYEKQLTEGYFSPLFYGLGEATIAWTRNTDRWHTALEAAPGLQQIGHGSALQGAYRGQATVAYTLAPGAQVGLSAAYAANALQRLTTSGTGYRYWSFGLTAGWSF